LATWSSSSGVAKLAPMGADHLAVDHDRKSALHLDEAPSRYRRVTTVVDCVLQR
jgi:hypothetical protein